MHRASLPALAALTLFGCGPKQPGQSEAPYKNRISERRLPDEDLLLQEVDFDADGQVEVYNYYRERSDAPRLLVRKELDLNRDTRVDLISYFDIEGRLEKEEMDADHDGMFDWTDHFQDGVRVMSEYDTDHDGKPNVFKYFARNDDGSVYIDRKERDSDGDGKIDVWERFNEEGLVIRTGRDTDGDGKMDVREE